MLDDYIRGFNRVLSPDQCKSLIDHFESDCEHEKSVQPNRVTRSDKQIWLKDGEYKNTLKEAVTKMLDVYLSEFPYVYRGNLQLEIPHFKVQRTDTKGGGFHNFHSESSHWENSWRVLVWTIYLNDIPEGEGETEFLYEKIRIQPKTGLGCSFPSAWMYQHRGNPVHTHSKYIATGWYYYPEEVGHYGSP